MARWRPFRSISSLASPARSCFSLRVKAPPDDGNPRDNEREAEIEVVDRKTRVLLFASGPMRDYQFLRNQLHRDATMIADVLPANRPARHFAGRQQDSRPLPQHARGALPIRLHRRVRPRLDEARRGPSRPRREVGFRRGRRPDRGRGADSNAEVDSQHRARQAPRPVSGRVSEPAHADG